MTIDEVLDMSAEKLAAMSDDELKAHLSHYFVVTRPEIVRQRNPNVVKANTPKLSATVLQGMELLKGKGIDMSVFLKHKPKR